MVLVLKPRDLKADSYIIVRNPSGSVQVRRSRWTKANWMIQQIFGVADGSFRMLQCKRESLIPDTSADKELNAAANKAVDTDKERNTAADKELNTAADEAVDADKQLNAVAEPLLLIKDQITRWMKIEQPTSVHGYEELELPPGSLGPGAVPLPFLYRLSLRQS